MRVQVLRASLFCVVNRALVEMYIAGEGMFLNIMRRSWRAGFLLKLMYTRSFIMCWKYRIMRNLNSNETLFDGISFAALIGRNKVQRIGVRVA